MKTIQTENFNADIFKLFNDRWALLTAGEPGAFNSMTISWGSLGTIWGQPVATVYVRESRYTLEFIRKHPTFTISFFDEKYRDDLALLGSVSGRDGDKIAKTRLTPCAVEDSVGFVEAELTFVCEKRSLQLLTDVPEDVLDQFYPDRDLHWSIIAPVKKIFEK